jgi:TolB protein
MGGDEWLRDIWVMRADGSRPVRLTQRGVPDLDPAWSPDGRLIAYASWQTHLGPRIWVVRSTGGGRRPITPFAFQQYAFSPTWSPDGKRIAFAAGNYSNNVGALYVINSDGTGLRRLLREPTRIEDPAWSPDGRTIAYVRRGQSDDLRIILIPVGGGARRVIARDASAPTWSPDGTRIAFSRSNAKKGVHVFVVKADGSGSRHVGRGYAPSWSPDGKWIAASEAYSYPPSFAHEIGVLPASGGRVQNLTKTLNAEDYNPTWSPDGRHIAFESTRAALRNP